MKYLLLGSITSACLNFLSIPLLYVIFDAETVGLISTYVATSLILSSVAGLRLELSIVKNSNAKVRTYTVVHVRILAIVTTLMLSIISAIFLNITDVTKSFYSDVLIISSLTYIIFLGSSLSNNFLSENHFRKMAAIDFLKSIFPIYSFIVIGLLQNGDNFDFGHSVFLFLSLLHTGMIVSENYKTRPNNLRNLRFLSSRIKRLFILNKSLITTSAPSIFINTIFNNLPVFLTSTFFGLAAGGYVHNSMRLLNGPIQVLGNPARNIFYKRYAVMFRLRATLTNKDFTRLFLIFAVASILTSSVLYTFLYFIIKQLNLSAEYAPMEVVISLLLILYVFRFPMTITSNLTIIYRREFWVLKWNIVQLLAVSALLIILGRLNVSLENWLTAYSAIGSVFVIVLWVFHFNLVKGTINFE